MFKLALATSALGVALAAPYKAGVQTDCTETILVTDVDFRQVDCSVFNFPCDDLEGTYYFTGYDSQGTPRYTQPETGAFFSTQIDQLNNPTFGVLASTGFTYNGSYFAGGWDHFADVRFLDQCTNVDIFEVESGGLEGSTLPIYFPQINAPYPPLYIVAFLDDCKGIGFDNQVPTFSPTPQPSLPTPQPVAGITCPNYDNTQYSDCSGDVNCANCQPWGCASCASGFYKMGLFQRCQSCTGNYPGCSTCGDWNGCTACSTGTLLFSSTCNDEVCQ